MTGRTLQPPAEREAPVRSTSGHCIATHAVIVAMRRRFSAMHTSFHSARTRWSPRMLNCRDPSTFLIQPLGGSAIHLRLR